MQLFVDLDGDFFHVFKVNFEIPSGQRHLLGGSPGLGCQPMCVAVRAANPQLKDSLVQLVRSYQPTRRIADISLNIPQRLRVSLVALARRLSKKTRTTHLGVPVVIHKVMKAGLRDAASKLIAVVVNRAFKCNHQIKRTPGSLAFAGGDYVRKLFAFRDANCSLVRMSGEELDYAIGRGRIAH